MLLEVRTAGILGGGAGELEATGGAFKVLVMLCLSI